MNYIKQSIYIFKHFVQSSNLIKSNEPYDNYNPYNSYKYYGMNPIFFSQSLFNKYYFPNNSVKTKLPN